MIRGLCMMPVLDAQKRAILCNEAATTERDVATGYGDERVPIQVCDKHAAKLDTPPTPPEAPANDAGPVTREGAAWAGAILGIAELTGADPETIAALAGPMPSGEKGDPR